MTTIDDQEIVKIGRTPNMCGGTLPLFLTFDGRWYRVRTRLETLGKFLLYKRAIALYNKSQVAE